MHVADRCPSCLRTQDVQVRAHKQHSEHPGFRGYSTWYDCTACVRAIAADCGFPTLAPANSDAWELYLLLQGQQRAGSLDVLGLDYTVIVPALDLLEVEDEERRLLFEKLIVIDHEMQSHRARNREAQEARRRAEDAARGIRSRRH